MKAGLADPLNIGGGRKIILVTCRSRPSDSTASHVLKGIVEAHLEKLNPFSKYLRNNYMLMVVPLLSTDGITFGNSGTDANGNHLDVLMSNICINAAAQKVKSPELVCFLKLVSRHIQQQDEFVFYCHLESTFNDAQGFVKTCVQSASQEELKDRMKFPILVSESCNHTNFKSFAFDNTELGGQKDNQARSFHELFFKKFGISNSFTFAVPSVGPSSSPIEEEQYLTIGRCFHEAVGVYLIQTAVLDGKVGISVERELADAVAKRCENLGRAKRINQEYLETAETLVVVPCVPSGVYSSETACLRWTPMEQRVEAPTGIDEFAVEQEEQPPKKLFEGLLGQHLRKGLMLMMGTSKSPDFAHHAERMLQKELTQPTKMQPITPEQLVELRHSVLAENPQHHNLSRVILQSDPHADDQKDISPKIKSHSVEEKSSSKRLEDLIGKMVGNRNKFKSDTPISEFIATGADEMESRTNRYTDLVTDFSSQQTSRSGAGSRRAIFRISNDPAALKRVIDNQIKTGHTQDGTSGYMRISNNNNDTPTDADTQVAAMLINRLKKIPGPVKPVSRIINSCEQSVAGSLNEKVTPTVSQLHRKSTKELNFVRHTGAAVLENKVTRRHGSVRVSSNNTSVGPNSRVHSIRGRTNDSFHKTHTRPPSLRVGGEDQQNVRQEQVQTVFSIVEGQVPTEKPATQPISRQRVHVPKRDSLISRADSKQSTKHDGVKNTEHIVSVGQLLAVDTTKRQARLEFAASCTSVGFGNVTQTVENKPDAKSDRRKSSNQEQRRSCWIPAPSVAIDMRSLWAEREKLIKGTNTSKTKQDVTVGNKENVVKLNGYNIVFQRPAKGSKKILRQGDPRIGVWPSKLDQKVTVNKTFTSGDTETSSIRIIRKAVGIPQDHSQANDGRRSLFVPRDLNATFNL